jgi:hypothetical protein
VDFDRPLSLWRPLPCVDRAGAASASGPVDLSLCVNDDGVVVRALAVLRVFDTEWDCPGAGRCELVPLAEVVVVGRLAVPRVPLTDWRSPGGDWVVAGGSSPHDDVVEAAGCTLAAPRASPGLTICGHSGAAAERAAQVGSWRVAGLLLLLLLLLGLGLVVVPAVLGPPTLHASSSPSTLFEPVTDLLLPVRRLTFKDASSLSSHEDPSSSQPSGPSCGEEGGD